MVGESLKRMSVNTDMMNCMTIKTSESKVAVCVNQCALWWEVKATWQYHIGLCALARDLELQREGKNPHINFL